MQHTTRFIFLSCLVTFIYCNNIGDVIPMLKRVQFNQQRTDWSDIDFSQAPRFGIKKETALKGAQELIKAFNTKDTNDDVKISFAFHHPQFVTPWITLLSSKENKKPHYLTQIDFTFVFTGDTITEVKYHSHYSDEDEKNLGKAPDAIIVTYHWHEMFEKDASTSLIFLYVLSFIAGGSVIFFIIKEISDQ